MGKKTKTGKSRKDKYYHLAKETGFRSRAAFKLLQLNRKFQFLEKSRVCIDLCAAPGGWLQVCQQTMPMSSIILGVDLVGIKPLPNVVTFQEDITTEKCRQTLRKEMHTWKADVVLHDGAPNVGRNWIHDAFQQAQLTLQALKLATDFLRKGGWFVTKVFRSKDYHALLWVLKQLFSSVHATKPQASRNESAEIFIVCQYYKAPDKLDPKFLDIKHVFKEVDDQPKQTINIIRPEKKSKKVEGYDENDTAFYHKVMVSHFIAADNHLELLAEAHELVFDDDDVKNHPKTTQEVKECCKDIKVLGKKEIRFLLTWRKNLAKYLAEKKQEEQGTEMDIGEASDEENSEAEEQKLAERIDDMKAEQEQDMKRKRKRVMKEKKKLRDKMALKMIHPGDHIEETDDICLFDIKKIKKKRGLEDVQKEDMIDESSDSEPEAIPEKNRKYLMAYDRHKEALGSGDEDDDEGHDDEGEEEGKNEKQGEETFSTDDEVDLEMESDDDEEAKANPLVVSLESKNEKLKRKTDMWFSKEMFTGLEDEEDEDLEVEKMMENYKKKGGQIIERKDNINSEGTKKKKVEKKELITRDSDDQSDSEYDSDDDDDDDSEMDYEVNDEIHQMLVKKSRGDAAGNTKTQHVGKNTFEIVPKNQQPKKIIKLDPVELAIGEELIKSSKRRRELIEMSYNRYTHGDEDLPDWFAKDEQRHSRKQLPITKEQIDAYKERYRTIDARPIKKIAEAKARKKRKMTKKLERVRKRAGTVSDNVEMTDREKWKQIKELYKKAGLLSKKKKEVTYVVAKKGGGKKPVRPAGVKGFYKVVDPRLKKDKRGITQGKGSKGNAKNMPKNSGKSRGKSHKGKGKS